MKIWVCLSTDPQQLSLIRGMAQAFFLDTEIIGCPTTRETDGLAMSSRNLNLSEDDRELAPRFHENLSCAEDNAYVAQAHGDVGFRADYVSTIGGWRFGAVLLGDDTELVRLIDNVKRDG